MKKIAIFVPYLRDSGISKVAAVQSVMFDKAGYDVDVIVRDANVVYTYAGNLVNLDIKSRKSFLKIFTYIEVFFKFKKLKEKFEYDIIISHTPHCDMINVYTKKNEIIITTVHSNTSKKYSAISRLALKYIVNKSDKVIAVSKLISETMQQNFSKSKNKIQYIYNSLDIEEIVKKSFEPLPSHLPNRYILTAGRISEEKGQWHLIKAFSLLCKEISDIKLVILGEGSMRKELENLTKDLGVSKNVLFEGFQNNPYNYMKSAEMFILTSLHEGFPVVLMESMACGTPVLATDCTGPREIIAPDKSIYESLNYDEKFEYGFLLPDFANTKDLYCTELSKGETTLLEKLKKILLDKILLDKYINKSKERASMLSSDKIMDEWEKLFLELKNLKEL